MYDLKEIKHAGKHDWDRSCAERQSKYTDWLTFSINIYPLEIASNGKRLKKSKGKVRIIANHQDKEKAFDLAERISKLLDLNEYKGPKTVRVK